MRILRQQQPSFFDGITCIVLILLVTSVVSLGADQPKQDLPVVLDAAVPFYPRDAQLAHIEGVVRLRISTDGEAVSGVELLEGQVTLARAAKENVKTWRLKWHARTTFDATFRYTLLPDLVCEAGNSTVLLRLPLEVEVSAKGVKTCDPATDIKPKEQSSHPWRPGAGRSRAGNRCRRQGERQSPASGYESSVRKRERAMNRLEIAVLKVPVPKPAHALPETCGR